MLVAEFLERVSSAELSEWIALWEVRGEEAERAERQAKKSGPGGVMGRNDEGEHSAQAQEALAAYQQAAGSDG